MKAKVKTVDVNALEWFDKVNGNSYFAGTVTVNYGMKTEKRFIMPYQYGYGSQYESEAMDVLINSGCAPDAEKYNNGGKESIWQYCRRRGIIYRHSKQENCKLRELKNIK